MRIENSRIQDVELIAGGLRKADIDEIFASSHHTPDMSIGMGLDVSPYCKTVFVNHKPMAILGLIPMTETEACTWGFCTEEVTKHKKEFYKFSKMQLKEMLKIFPVLFNYVDCRNKTSIRWLKALGAEFETAKPFGFAMIPFQKFYFRRKDNV